MANYCNIVNPDNPLLQIATKSRFLQEKSKNIFKRKYVQIYGT